MPFRQLSYLPDRRSTRLEQSVHIVVRGLNASRVAYEERVSTLSVSCHGCRYLSRNNVLRGDVATLEVIQRNGDGEKFPVEVRVVSVKPVGGDNTLFDVAVELTQPQDIWDIRLQPEDWTEFTDTMERPEASRELRIVPRPETTPTPDSKQTPLKPVRAPQSSESRVTPALPPLLVHLAAGLDEQVGVEFAESRKLPLVESTRESLLKLCLEIEREAATVLENTVATYVEQMTCGAQGLNQALQGLSRNTYERWLRRFAQETASTGRKLA